MRPTDLALLRIPGVPTVSPGRADRRRRGHPARPGRRRVPRPAVGGAHRRLRTRAAADVGPSRHRAGVLARRPVAGLSRAPSRAAGRRSGCCRPRAARPRRLTDHPLGAGAPVWSPDSRRLAYAARVPEQGRYGTVEGVGARGGAAAADHHPAVPARRRRLPGRPAQPGLRARPARRLRRRHRATGRRRCRSPRATPTAPTSAGARTAGSWCSSPRGTSVPTATWCATSTRSRPTAPGCGG